MENAQNIDTVSQDTLDVASNLFNKGKEIEVPEVKKRGRPPKVAEVVEAPKVEPKIEPKVDTPAAENIIETPFFKISQPAEKKEPDNSDVDFADWIKLTAYAKEEGFDLKTPNDLKNVFVAIKEKENKIKEFEPKITELQNKNTSFEKLIVNMPPELANPFLAWAEGKDYKAEIRKIQETPFDLTLGADKHDELELVNHFGDEKYTKDEWDELEDKTKNSLKRSAKQLYDVKQHEFLGKRNKANNEKIEKQNKFTTSVDVAITNLKKEFPDMKESDLKEVRTQMLGGINKTLFNDDGTWRETAGKQISMAIYGEKTLGQMKDALMNKVQAEKNKMLSDEREKILIKGQDQVNIGTGGEQKQKLEDVVKKSTGFLKKVGK